MPDTLAFTINYSEFVKLAENCKEYQGTVADLRLLQHGRWSH